MKWKKDLSGASHQSYNNIFQNFRFCLTSESRRSLKHLLKKRFVGTWNWNKTALNTSIAVTIRLIWDWSIVFPGPGWMNMENGIFFHWVVYALDKVQTGTYWLTVVLKMLITWLEPVQSCGSLVFNLLSLLLLTAQKYITAELHHGTSIAHDVPNTSRTIWTYREILERIVSKLKLLWDPFSNWTL